PSDYSHSRHTRARWRWTLRLGGAQASAGEHRRRSTAMEPTLPAQTWTHVREDGSAGTATSVDRPLALAWSRETISRPNGSSETGMSLKFARPSGIAITVRHSRTPVMRCPIANHQPHKRNQTTLASADAAPASLRLTTVFPNGHSAKMPMRSDAMPNG